MPGLPWIFIVVHGGLVESRVCPILGMAVAFAPSSGLKPSLRPCPNSLLKVVAAC